LRVEVVAIGVTNLVSRHAPEEFQQLPAVGEFVSGEAVSEEGAPHALRYVPGVEEPPGFWSQVAADHAQDNAVVSLDDGSGGLFVSLACARDEVEKIE
jgi:hypothetical protein